MTKSSARGATFPHQIPLVSSPIEPSLSGFLRLRLNPLRLGVH